MMTQAVLLFSTLSIGAIVASLKVFHFEESLPDLSYLVLSDSSEVPLPDVFILCTSHQQSKMDKRGFYQIYGADKQLWMTTKFDRGPGPQNSVGLWGTFGLEWIYYGEISQPKLFFWYHMCHKVDSSQGQISISVNGHRFATDIQVKRLKENRPLVLGGRIVVGKWTKVSITKDPVEQQFLASVSNINVFEARNLSIEALSSDACTVEGDVLPWSSPLWNPHGSGVETLDLKEENVCSGKGRYNLGLPVGLDQQQAVDTCFALGHGRMTTAKSSNELRQFAKWFQGVLPGRCGNIWIRVLQRLVSYLFYPALIYTVYLPLSISGWHNLRQIVTRRWDPKFCI